MHGIQQDLHGSGTGVSPRRWPSTPEYLAGRGNGGRHKMLFTEVSDERIVGLKLVKCSVDFSILNINLFERHGKHGA